MHAQKGATQLPISREVVEIRDQVEICPSMRPTETVISSNRLSKGPFSARLFASSVPSPQVEKEEKARQEEEM